MAHKIYQSVGQLEKNTALYRLSYRPVLSPVYGKARGLSPVRGKMGREGLTLTISAGEFDYYILPCAEFIL
jgi:hypothetical protein